MLYGAIIGDVVGSRFEFNNYKKKDFDLFHYNCSYTDDTIMSIAIYDACRLIKKEGYEVYEQAEQFFINSMQTWGRNYPNPKGGYGNSFYYWLFNDNPKPYNSFGNGAAMRVSAVGWMFDTLEEVEKYAKWSAKPTHNHPEGIKGAQSVAGAIFLARTTHDKKKIKKYVESYGYKLKSCDFMRPSYQFDVTCQGTVPVAVEAFLESKSFEDAIRLAISMGGDSDTIGAITGSIAEAYYGIPEELITECQKYLPEELLEKLKFEADYKADMWSYNKCAICIHKNCPNKDIITKEKCLDFEKEPNVSIFEEYL